MEETTELDQTETEEPRTEEPVTEEPRTEEPVTGEHDVPHIPDMPEPDVVDHIVIVEVVKEDDEKETQIDSDDQIEKETIESVSETVLETETDDREAAAADTPSAETYESSVETETQPESDEETESDTDTDTASDDAVFDFDSDQTGSLEGESETEIETYSEMLLNIDSDINTFYLQSIDLKLTCIIFILLFSVCERKLRYGVRSLCGRIKND